MSVDLSVVGNHQVKNVVSGETVELKTFWQNQNAVIIFFRRWGCMFCRLWAKELGEIAPILKKYDIKLVGVGVEEIGAKEFYDGKFFDGDLYYVANLSTYQNLGFKRFNVLTILTSLLWKKSREAITKSRAMGVGGNLKGDWVQTGGALIVKQGGDVLQHFVQNGPGEHLSNEEILKNFGLEHEYKPESKDEAKAENKDGVAMECATEAQP